jgi:aspartate/glutamate racemase
LYKHKIVQEGLECVHLTEDIQKEVEGIIETVKLTGNNEVKQLQNVFSTIIKKIIDSTNANGIIFGCTEFTYFKGFYYEVPIVDSSFELVYETIRS